MVIFGKKFFLTFFFVAFCIFSNCNGQEITDRDQFFQGVTEIQPIDEAEVRNTINTIKELLKNNDFQALWGMVTEAKRNSFFEGNIEKFKAYLGDSDIFNKIENFEVDKIEPLSSTKVKVISPHGKVIILVKEGDTWKFAAKGINALKSAKAKASGEIKGKGKAKRKALKGKKPVESVEENLVDQNLEEENPVDANSVDQNLEEENPVDANSSDQNQEAEMN